MPRTNTKYVVERQQNDDVWVTHPDASRPGYATRAAALKNGRRLAGIANFFGAVAKGEPLPIRVVRGDVVVWSSSATTSVPSNKEDYSGLIAAAGDVVTAHEMHDMQGLALAVHLLKADLALLAKPAIRDQGCTCGEAYSRRAAGTPKCAYCR